MSVFQALSYTAAYKHGKRILLHKTSEGDAEKGGNSISVNNGY